MVRIKHNKQKTLYLGNLYSKRDWGHAKDYVEAMWKILNRSKAEDFVISTNKQFTIKQFVNLVAKKLGLNIVWKGKGLNEKAFLEKKPIIQINKRYFRPLEVNNLKGNYKKRKSNLVGSQKLGLINL